MENVAIAHLPDNQMDEETDTRSANAHRAKLTIILPQCGESDSILKTTQTTVIQTPPGMMSIHATTAVSEDHPRATASTSNVLVINPSKSTKTRHPYSLLQQDIAT